MTANTVEDTTAIAVDARQISKIFGTGANMFHALDNVSVQIRENEFFTLLGPSGCGKTTLLRLIAGFDHPNAGSILLHGKDISNLPPYQRPVNTVFQSYALFPHMTVAENIGFGLKMLKQSASEVEAVVNKMLALVKMEPMRDRTITQISGGQQQRVALARALAPQPKVLLLDEPLSALDLKLRKDMQIELKRLQHETGITFIFVTHDQEEALTMSDRIAVINAGKVLQIGTPREIYQQPADRFVADFIGDTNFINATITEIKGDAVKVKLSSGATLATHQPEGIKLAKGANVTLVVRPEHAELTSAKNGADISGSLTNQVYFGTDTHYHINIANDEPFIIRSQNNLQSANKLTIGQEVGIKIDSGAAQILKD